MKFKTQLSLNITIKDPRALYSTNYDDMLLQHARELYEKKCRDGQYIQSIDRLINRSLPRLIKRDLTAKVREYVIVEATAIRYDKYDFVHGLKVQRVIAPSNIKNMDIVYCSNDHVACLLWVPNNTDTFDVQKFKVNDVIPVRVRESIYHIGEQYIRISGGPFVPYVPDQMFYSIGKITNDTKQYFKQMVAPLFDEAMAKKNTLDQKRWKQISDMLIPFKKVSKSSRSMPLITDIDMLQGKNIGIDWHVDPTELRLTSDKDGVVISDEQKNTITRLAFEFVKWLTFINDMTEQCTADEEYNKLDYIWSMYEANKLD